MNEEYFTEHPWSGDNGSHEDWEKVLTLKALALGGNIMYLWVRGEGPEITAANLDRIGNAIHGYIEAICLAPGRFPSSAAPASSRELGEGGGSAPFGPGLGCDVVSMRSRTAPWPLVDMAVYGELVPSRATRRRWLQGGSVREWRGRCSAILAWALAAGR